MLPTPVSHIAAARLIEDFFGPRVTIQWIDTETQQIVFVLYQAIAFGAGVDPRRGAFDVSVLLYENVSVSSPLGKKTLLRSGEDQIRGALQAIDEYCRLRLPDKYLEAFDAAMLRSTAPDKTPSTDE